MGGKSSGGGDGHRSGPDVVDPRRCPSIAVHLVCSRVDGPRARTSSRTVVFPFRGIDPCCRRGVSPPTKGRRARSHDARPCSPHDRRGHHHRAWCDLSVPPGRCGCRYLDEPKTSAADSPEERRALPRTANSASPSPSPKEKSLSPPVKRRLSPPVKRRTRPESSQDTDKDSDAVISGKAGTLFFKDY